MRELEEAPPEYRMEEAGDLLFAAVNLVRAYGIPAEEALRGANAKFERRYRGMEQLAGSSINGRSPDEMDALWESVKKSE